jgi:hypothetical protein
VYNHLYSLSTETVAAETAENRELNMHAHQAVEDVKVWLRVWLKHF